jgi:hypothetical protein
MKKLCKSVIYGSLGTYVYWYHLTQKTDKINLVFDLDHTLIRSKSSDQLQYLNIKNPAFFILNEEYCVWTRPYYRVLNLLNKITHLHLFTAATKNYADEIVNNMYYDIFKTRLYRESCPEYKDLNLIHDNSILVDDKSYNRYNNQHFYHIKQYDINNHYDVELIKLFIYILKIYIRQDYENIKNKIQSFYYHI